jgi:hypothetical protein
LNVEYRARGISLREYVLTFAKFGDRFSGPDLGEESLGIKRVLGRFNQDGTLVRWTLARCHTTTILQIFTCLKARGVQEIGN